MGKRLTLLIDLIIAESPSSSFGGFQAPPSMSRPPTQHYDRESLVLVLDESDDVLKLLKMHLNKFFSRVVVVKSGTEAAAVLKSKSFDLVIADGAPFRKSNSEFLKKLGAKHRHIPVVLTRGEKSPPFTAGDFPLLVVAGVVAKPFDLDDLHVAMRRGLNMRTALKDLSILLKPGVAIGKLVRTATLTDRTDRRQILVLEIRKKLVEEIED
jgi:CheY-like chemotaxis protein